MHDLNCYFLFNLDCDKIKRGNAKWPCWVMPSSHQEFRNISLRISEDKNIPDSKVIMILVMARFLASPRHHSALYWLGNTNGRKLLQWYYIIMMTYNERDGVSNHRRLDLLFNRLFRRESKKNLSSAPLAFVRGNHQWPVHSPHKGPVTRKMSPFEDFIMNNDANLFRCSMFSTWWV